MSKYLAIAPAAAAAFLLFGASSASANECGLNDKQLAAGWNCDLVVTLGDTIPSWEPAGGSHMCQYFEATSTTTQWVATNPAGNEVDGKSTEPQVVEGEPVKVGGNVVCP